MCDVVHTKLLQLSDVLSIEERDMARKLVQLGQSHTMVNISSYWWWGEWCVVGLFLFAIVSRVRVAYCQSKDSCLVHV